MHELSIVLSILAEIGDESEARALHGIEVVHLKVGVFSGVDRAALRFAWELACQDTPLEHAQLDIETVPLTIHCAVCREDRQPPSLYQLCCPVCGAPSATIVTGRELEVVSLEVAA
ncbi:MAG TPA: hydrogenase maturation nickel metallochaperone HypA [Granulicella sp.]|jgi:hydrogenase nickel incorporation protein HypA/HybF|nr:hydrogenase maturation nickel metallochaperone HypA [Granulicella sp.]